MEKRLIASVFLSFAVLYIWALLTQSPESKNASIQEESLSEYSQDIAEIQDNQKPDNDVIVSEMVAKTPDIDTSELSKQLVLENDKIRLQFSNIGGSLVGATILSSDHELPLSQVDALIPYNKLAFDLVEHKSNEVHYRIVSEGTQIDKIYTIGDTHLVTSKIKISNKSSSPKQFNAKIKAFGLEMSSLDNSGGLFSGASQDGREAMMYEYSALIDGKVKRKNNAGKFEDKEKDIVLGSLQWTGYRNRYYTIISKPLYPTKGYYIDPVASNKLVMGPEIEGIVVNPSDSMIFESNIYIGPQDKLVLKAYNSDFNKIISYNIGGFIDWFALGLGDPAAQLLLTILLFLKSFIPSWGICIILLACLICLATYPLTMKGMKSMKRMQQVQPEMAKIKEKYKDNPEKMNKETMELYKKHKINPLGGCLPMFIQMPIFFGIIQLLWRYVGLKGESFLWIKDLAEPDRLIMLSQSFPIIGNEINILPIIIFFLTILQQKYTSKNMTTTDPNMAMQQKMFKFMLPAMIIFFFYRFASAIALYFTVFYIYQIFMQRNMALARVKD